MTRKDISDGVGNISTRHIQEAASYMAAEKKVSFFKKPFGRSMIAAVLALCILAGGISIFSPTFKLPSILLIFFNSIR